MPTIINFHISKLKVTTLLKHFESSKIVTMRISETHETSIVFSFEILLDMVYHKIYKRNPVTGKHGIPTYVMISVHVSFILIA